MQDLTSNAASTAARLSLSQLLHAMVLLAQVHAICSLCYGIGAPLCRLRSRPSTHHKPSHDSANGRVGLLLLKFIIFGNTQYQILRYFTLRFLQSVYDVLAHEEKEIRTSGIYAYFLILNIAIYHVFFVSMVIWMNKDASRDNYSSQIL